RFAARGPLNVARGGLASRIDHDPNLVVATPKLREFGERHGVGRYPASRWLGRHGGPGEVLVLLRIEPPGSDEIVGTSLQRLRGCRELTCLEQDRLGQAAIEVDAADRSRRLDLCLARIGWRHGWWRTRRLRHRIGKHGGPEIEILLTVAGLGPQALDRTRTAGRVHPVADLLTSAKQPYPVADHDQPHQRARLRAFHEQSDRPVTVAEISHQAAVIVTIVEGPDARWLEYPGILSRRL